MVDFFLRRFFYHRFLRVPRCFTPLISTDKGRSIDQPVSQNEETFTGSVIGHQNQIKQQKFSQFAHNSLFKVTDRGMLSIYSVCMKILSQL
jgi:hypothetical protein